MKQGWEIKKLGEIGTVITGSTPSTKDDSNYSSKDYCFVKPSDISNETISLIRETEAYISEKAYLKSRKLPRGSVLTTCIGIIGKVGILKVDATCNQQINGIIPNDNCITPEFLAYSLISRKSYLQGIANAPVVPIINKKEFSDVSIPVPPLPEQEKIVSELDCLSGLIEKKRQQLKELDALAQSIFYEMFGNPVENERGWEVKKLGKVCSLKAGKSIKANELSPNLTDGLYPCFGGNGIRGYIAKVSHKESFPIIGRQGALCGNVVLSTKEFYATEHAVVVQPLIIMNTIWLFYTLKFMNLNRLAQGVAQPGLSVNRIVQESIPLPPLPLQQTFAQKVEAIEKQKELIKQSIIEAETLLASRMQYYFEEG